MELPGWGKQGPSGDSRSANESGIGSRLPQTTSVAEEESLRAGFYALLSGTLAGPPDRPKLDRLTRLEGDQSPLGTALGALAEVAREIDLEAAEDEYTKLFYGMGEGGEVLPYASYYLTGHLHDKPLARLRGDMERLGIAHSAHSREPEDHIAFLLEMMHGLILGHFGAGPLGLAEQQRFFDAHLAPWTEDFFTDLEAAESSTLYQAVGRVGRLYLAVEKDAFAMAARDDNDDPRRLE